MAEQDFRNSAFYKELLELSKEQGYVTLLDIVSAIKKHKDAPGDIDAISEALKEDGVQYTETEDSDPDFTDEPSEEDLENFDDDFDSDDIDDESTEEGPTDDDLESIENEDDEDDETSSSKKKDEDDDEDDEELCCSLDASASCLSTSEAVPRAVPECCVQYPGVLLCLYQPLAFEGQAEVARSPLFVQ